MAEFESKTNSWLSNLPFDKTEIQYFKAIFTSVVISFWNLMNRQNNAFPEFFTLAFQAILTNFVSFSDNFRSNWRSFQLHFLFSLDSSISSWLLVKFFSSICPFLLWFTSNILFQLRSIFCSLLLLNRLNVSCHKKVVDQKQKNCHFFLAIISQNLDFVSRKFR